MGTYAPEAHSKAADVFLDFADLFKPIVVDRVIFALVNRHEIKADAHFRKVESNSVLLSVEGKRIFLEKLEQKLDSRVGGRSGNLTYRQLMANEVSAFQRYVSNGEVHKPYKYY